MKVQNRKIQGCQPLTMHCAEIVKPDPVEISIDVESSANSHYFVAWDLGGEQLKVERYVRCPDNWQPHKVCGKELIITEENCEYMFYLPGAYRLSTVSGAQLPESLKYEDEVVTRETVALYFAEKRACCCE